MRQEVTGLFGSDIDRYTLYEVASGRIRCHLGVSRPELLDAMIPEGCSIYPGELDVHGYLIRDGVPVAIAALPAPEDTR